MDMRVVGQRLAPGVQHGEDADLGAELRGFGGERGQGLGGGAEQDRVDGGLVLEGDGGDRRRQGEDDVEIGNRQQFGLRGLRATSRAPRPWHFGQCRLRQVMGGAHYLPYGHFQ